MQLLKTIIVETISAVISWLHNNLRNIANVLAVICPYATGYAVVSAYQARGHFAVGGEWFVPLMFYLVIYLLRSIANRTGKGISIPKPSKRFTKVSDDGEITIPIARVEELLQYMCDLEDWMERKGLM